MADLPVVELANRIVTRMQTLSPHLDAMPI
jgi:hypothetical protein